ncbi:MAG: hypothetical protein LPK07_02625, partial [Hymenobacteraceae bacterium]|nr:hypothetical protein [Hymenobacteraceae bacterium]
PAPMEQALPDMTSREMLIAAPMIAMILWLGLYPQPVLDTAQPSINQQLQAYQQLEAEKNVAVVEAEEQELKAKQAKRGNIKVPL